MDSLDTSLIMALAIPLCLSLLVIALRKKIACNIIGDNSEATGATLSNADYKKQVNYIGLSVVGVLLAFLGAIAYAMIRFAPLEIYEELLPGMPWAVGFFAIGFCLYAIGLVLANKIRVAKESSTNN